MTNERVTAAAAQVASAIGDRLNRGLEKTPKFLLAEYVDYNGTTNEVQVLIGGGTSPVWVQNVGPVPEVDSPLWVVNLGGGRMICVGTQDPGATGGGPSALYFAAGQSGALVVSEWIPIYIPMAGTISLIHCDVETAAAVDDLVIRLTNTISNWDTTITQGNLSGSTTPNIAVASPSTWYFKLFSADNSARNLTVTLGVTP